MYNRDGVRVSGVGNAQQAIQGQGIQVNLFPGSRSDPVEMVNTLPSKGFFYGRESEISRALKSIDPSKNGSLSSTCIVGPPGVGKTALVVEVAYAALDAGWFPGGCLFVNVRGYDSEEVAPVSVTGIIQTLLLQLGISETDVPTTLPAREQLLGTVLRARELTLIVVDDIARDDIAEIVLTHLGQHKALCTSRHILPNIDAEILDLDLLDPKDAEGMIKELLLAQRPHDKRAVTARARVQKMASLCGYLPLALRIAAGRLAMEPHLAIADLIVELQDSSERLEALQVGNKAVRAAFMASYRRLKPEEAEAFKLCAVHQGPQFGVPAAAALLGMKEVKVRQILGELRRAHLLTSGNRSGYYAYHDLMRDFSYELGNEGVENLGECAQRMFEYYYCRCRDAIAHIEGAVPLGEPSGQFKSATESLAWLDLEQPSLVPVMDSACLGGHWGIATLLGHVISVYLTFRRRYDEVEEAAAIMIDCARKTNNIELEAEGFNYAGEAYKEMDKPEDAAKFFARAVRLFDECGHRLGVGYATANLGICYELLGRYDEAITAHKSDLNNCLEVGDMRGQASALLNLGLAYLAANNFKHALISFKASYRTACLNSQLRGQASALQGLGKAYAASCRRQKSWRCFERAAFIFRITSNSHLEASLLRELGVDLVDAGRIAKGVQVTAQAMSIFQLIKEDKNRALAFTLIDEWEAEVYEWILDPSLDEFP